MDTQLLKQQLIIDEGLSLKLYRDSVGVMTIGYGRNLDSKGISKSEAEYMLNNDIRDVQDDLDRYLPWWKNLDDVRQLVIANMCFNLGILGLLKFKITLTSVQNGDYKTASEQMLESLWAHQVGNRVVRLSQMMLTGQLV